MESKPAPAEDLGSLAAASFPLLVYEHGDPSAIFQTVLSVADGSLRTIQVPEICTYTCLETPSGLMLVVDAASLQCWLWNPQTEEKTALPAMDEAPPESYRCLLSDPVSSPDCFVLVYALGQPELLFCKVRGGGGGAWVRQSYDVGLYEIPGRSSTPRKRHINTMAAVLGKFYFLEAPNELGVFSFSRHDHGPELHLNQATLAATTPRFVSDAPQVVTLSYLLESDKELFLVCLFYLGCSFERVEEVSAYRMDFDKQEWCKVTDIGDRAFLLGPENFAASCPATEHGLRRGCVYFAFDFLGDSNEFHIFDLRDGTRERAAPAQDISALLRKPFWMVPVLQ